MRAASRCDRDGEGQNPEDDDSDGQLGDDVEDWTTEDAAIEEDDAEFEKAQGCWVDKVKGCLQL